MFYRNNHKTYLLYVVEFIVYCHVDVDQTTFEEYFAVSHYTDSIVIRFPIHNTLNPNHYKSVTMFCFNAATSDSKS